MKIKLETKFNIGDKVKGEGPFKELEYGIIKAINISYNSEIIVSYTIKCIGGEDYINEKFLSTYKQDNE